MASQGTRSSRSTKPSQREDHLERRPLEGSRRLSTASTSSYTSKIPTSTSSWFSLGRRKQGDVRALAPAAEIRSKKQHHTRLLPGSNAETFGSGPLVRGRREVAPAKGLGILGSKMAGSTSTFDSDEHPRNMLRRKASSTDQRSRYAQTELSATPRDPMPKRQHDTISSPEVTADTFPESIFGVVVPLVSASTSHLPPTGPKSSGQDTSSSRMADYQNFRPPKTPTAQLLPQPTPSFAHSSSSSTRRSESPGSFSRTSTPTSVSSYSPGVPAVVKSPFRARQNSPTGSRPPITRRWLGNVARTEVNAPDTQGLPAVRESATSSSSSSTVKGNERTEGLIVDRQAKSSSHLPNADQNNPVRRNVHLDRVALGKNTNSNTTRREYHTQGIPLQPARLDTTNLSQLSSKTPPPRPSRKGTPTLDDVSGPSPVIRSNLSRLDTTGHKRRESIERSLSKPDGMNESPSTGSALFGRSPSSASSRSSKQSRFQSLSPALTSSPQHQTGSEFDGSSIDEPSRIADRIVQEPSSVRNGKISSRFGIFSKRTRSPLENTALEGAERTAKKGPAAGTGHEGYGKYARRGRSVNTGTSASRNRSTSTSGASSGFGHPSTSHKSSFTGQEPEMDDFLRERLAPVVISGGQAFSDRDNGTDLYRTTSEASATSTVSSSNASATDPRLPSQRRLREPGSLIVNSTASSRRASRSLLDRRDIIGTSKSSDLKEAQSLHTPTLAARRSLHKSELFKAAEPVKVPAPINTREAAPSPSINSRDMIQSSALTANSPWSSTNNISEGREGNWLKSHKTEKPSKSPRKWNFFQRANQKASPARGPSSNLGHLQEVPVAVRRVQEARSVAHYAMLDNNGQDYVDEAESLIPNLRHLEHTYSPYEMPEPDFNPPMTSQQEYKQSILLPSPPNIAAAFASTQPSQPLTRPLQQHASHVSTEPPPPKEPRLAQVGRIPRVVSKRDRLHRPPPQSFSRPFSRSMAVDRDAASSNPELNPAAGKPLLGIQPEIVPSERWMDKSFVKPTDAPIRAYTAPMIAERDEFFRFPARVGSEVSGSSSSGVSNIAAATYSQQPVTISNEDDVWNEYDEFLDNVESPAAMFQDSQGRLSATIDKSRMAPAPLQIRKDPSMHSKSTVETTTTAAMPSLALPSPPIRSNLFSPNTASSPLSFSEFIAGYGDRNRGSTASRRQSSISGSHYSIGSVLSTTSDAEQKRLTQIMAEKTDVKSGIQSNLRFSALMTSRWLSFGRVLFSPVHNEIHSSKQDRVLVLDGLGNDDWSFYCALTYPDATIYNLSSFQRISNSSSRRRDPSSVPSPPNHRQMYHAGMGSPFPFPKGFFTAAVFRFPMAATEKAYDNAVSECKRVLRPGGFLEMSILELDMMNMGNRARRAVRELKVRMQVAEPNVSLKPISDNIQKMLGRKGFENLSRCMVTVPVAGLISDSRAGSFEESERSLGEMLKDASPHGDEGITKMVSKVGRWWYTRCYEFGVLPEDDLEQSIWADKALLKECEKRETGLKLLICYAQKPLAPKRRTISL